MLASTVPPEIIDVGFVGAVGLPGSGKSVTIELCGLVLRPPGTKDDDSPILILECRKVIDEYSTHDSPLGEALRAQKDKKIMERGGLYDDRPVCEAIYAKTYEEKKRRPHITTAFAAGFPRAPDQCKYLRHFRTDGLIHCIASEEIARKRMIKRWEQTPNNERRPDEPDKNDPDAYQKMNAIIDTRLQEYRRVTHRMLMDHGDRVVHAHTSQDLEDQVRRILLGLRSLEHPPLRAKDIALGLRDLQDPSHPFHAAVRHILNPPAKIVPFDRPTHPCVQPHLAVI